MPASTDRPFPFQTRRTELTARHVQAAVKFAKSADLGTVWEVSDAACVHLTLRVRGGSAQWLWRTNDQSICIGSAQHVSLTEARNRARKANTLRALGKDGSHYLKLRSIGTHSAEAERMAKQRGRFDTPSWSLRQIFDGYICYINSGEKRKYKDSYIKEIVRALTRYETTLFENIKAKDLTLDDLEKLRNFIRGKNLEKKNVASKTISHVKHALNWCWRDHRIESGLSAHSSKFWELLDAPPCTHKREHSPTVTELAQMLVLAERYRTRVDGQRGTGDSVLGAFFMLVFSGQRTRAICQLRRSGWVESNEMPGWRLATWYPSDMKSNRLHILPIPPAAVELISKYAPACGEGNYLFPSSKPGISIRPNALNKLLDRLSGKISDPRLQGNESRNIIGIHDVRLFTPHDVRRSIVTHLENQRLGAHASAILDHRDGRSPQNKSEPEGALLLMSPITQANYSTAQKIAIKAEGMKLWCDDIIREYERLTAIPPPACLTRHQPQSDALTNRYRHTAKVRRRLRLVAESSTRHSSLPRS